MSEITQPYTEGKKLQQLIAVITDLWTQKKLSEYEELDEELSAALSAAIKERSAITRKMEFQPHEPPLSEKFNLLFENLWKDFAVLASELDVLRSWAVLCHNHTVDAVDVLKASLQQVRENYKTALALCATPNQNLDQVYVNCSFLNRQPWDSFGGGSTCLDESGALQLMVATERVESTPITYTVVDGNGFAGDLHRAGYVTNAGAITGVQFYYNLSGKHDDLTALQDNNPLTWFEYEAVNILPAEYKKIKRYNIYYVFEGGKIRWCQAPEEGVLYMDLVGEFEKVVRINRISMVPFVKNSSSASLGGSSQKQIPKIVSFSVSEDGTEWETLSPEDFYLADSNNLEETEYYAVVPNWVFAPRSIGYIRLRMEVSAPQDNVAIGHVYYVNTETGERIDGANPPLDNPTLYDSETEDAVNKRARKLEVLSGSRWMLGIRDLTFSLSSYLTAGEAISKVSTFSKDIDYISLSVEEDLPQGDAYTTSIDYYVSADAGRTWTVIWPTNKERTNEYDTTTAVVAYKSNYPDELKEPHVTYVENVVGQPNRFCLKTVLKTSATEDMGVTPRLINYTANILFKE